MPKSIPLGKDLWYNQFCNPKYICEDWMFDLIEEINLTMQMEIPIVSNLQSCPVIIADYYAIIKEEINHIGMEDG